MSYYLMDTTVERASQQTAKVSPINNIKSADQMEHRTRKYGDGYQRLMSMDDRQLQDLGLTRSAIDAAVRGARAFQRREKPMNVFNDNNRDSNNDHRIAA